MRGADLAVFADGGGERRVGGGAAAAVVLRHVGFYLVRVCAGGGLPAGFLGGGVEVVGEVFGVGVADFPLGGEAGVGGGGGLGDWEGGSQKVLDWIGKDGEEGVGRFDLPLLFFNDWESIIGNFQGENCINR